METDQIQRFASDCGFEIAGVAPATPHPDWALYREWVDSGHAGAMAYLTEYRADRRADPRSLLENARSVICVGKVYNGPEPRTADFDLDGRGWISRYAWGEDYHTVVRAALESLVARLREATGEFHYKICCDTAPLLERSYARWAGLGWIGRNTCLINQKLGSWLFLGSILTSLDLPTGSPPPDRCGTCRRCIDACPTQAIVPRNGRWTVDSRLCISYFTIELHANPAEGHRPGIGHHVFGCDICQDVCPWNNRAAVTADTRFHGRHVAPPLEQMAAISAEEFRRMFRGSPVSRARYRGFLKNVAIAMGNSRRTDFLQPLQQLARQPEPVVAEAARWAITRLETPPPE